jgi:hypothetical protein
MTNEIIKSFRKMLRDISDLKMYTYTISSTNIVESIQARSSTNVASGVTTFFIEGFLAGSWNLIIANGYEPYDILNRYIKITLPSGGTEKYILITNYNDATGEITLKDSFGEDITTTDEFEIVVLDSIFIRDQNDISLDGRVHNNRTFLRLDLDIKTKLDADKSKSREYRNLIKCQIARNRYKLNIFEDDLVTRNGQGRFDDKGDYSERADLGDQLIDYLGSVVIKYGQDYR